MPKRYVWEVQSAGRKSKKEKAMKAMGGMIVGVRVRIK